MRFERHVVRLGPAIAVPRRFTRRSRGEGGFIPRRRGEGGPERGIHRALDVRDGAEAFPKLDPRRPALGEQTADVAIRLDVRTPEAVDRLLRIADDEQL